MYPRYSTANALAKGKALCTSAHLLAQNAACVAVPATTYQVTNRPEISAPGRLEPVRRQVKVAKMAAIASSGTNWMATMVESGTKPGSGSGLNNFPDSHSVPYCKPNSTMKPSVSAKMLVRYSAARPAPMVEKFRCSTCSAITKNVVNGTT